ncbi:hypothetical protein JTB14_030243 [Gonioctena quinquepunctata]|nr:hypothetical protein JTB14_030243 [Gonioctena quinquepunctata]
MKHIPHEKITQIAEKHLKTDPGFIAAIKYMQGGAWKKLVENIRVNKAWIAFKDHMTHYGFDVDTIIHCSDTFIKNANITRDSNAPKSLNSFMEDVEESIPVADIISYLHQKMRKNVTLQELFDKISSKESNKIVQGALNIPEVQQMMKELNSMDLNLYEFLSFVYSFLGWGEFKVPK